MDEKNSARDAPRTSASVIRDMALSPGQFTEAVMQSYASGDDDHITALALEMERRHELNKRITKERAEHDERVATCTLDELAHMVARWQVAPERALTRVPSDDVPAFLKHVDEIQDADMRRKLKDAGERVRTFDGSARERYELRLKQARAQAEATKRARRKAQKKASKARRRNRAG